MKKGRRADLTNLVLFTQLGLSVVSPILVCAVAGYLLKKYAGMPSWALVLFILFGLASGICSAVRLVKRMIKLSEANDPEEKHGGNRQDE